eukprot:CAMPEP_0203751134 /NCGR_PEP_ID=MMETSP0098-20131031/5254_1 /ASSEMBLY_ACC=CAM_ASM_000208 /TAXON_ID=96639 /ORGANISM=" , Strain NY0313808BC1" /LENGTH=676 /DNA_ID=CAMNT_0050640721 /DNA_START=169 /DNA_END=2196 /DNA_ORIENTATION=+
MITPLDVGVRGDDNDTQRESLVQSLEVDLEHQGGGGFYASKYGLDGGDEEEEEWVGTANLDEFFSRVYSYYYEGGFSCIVAKSVVNILTLGFTVVFSTFLLGFVNWHGLMSCKDEATCKGFYEYVITLDDHDSLAFRVFVVLYCLVFTIYWLYTVVSFIPTIRRSWEIRSFFIRLLKIPTRELQTMEWSEIVNRMIHLQESGEYPIQINGSSFGPKEVVMRIMRKKNYFIALINERVLPVGTTMFNCSSSSTWFLGKNLELMLEFCVLDYMFNDQFQLRHDFKANPNKLKVRFILCGLLNLAVMPFSLGFMIIYSFLKYAEEFHSKKNYLGPRWWSPYALWEFREYDEVEHIFEKRTVASIKHADLFLKQFPSPVPTVIAGGVSFITGAFVAVLMLFTLMDESIVLHVRLEGRNLVWYIAVFSGVLAISRAFVPPLEETIFNPSKAMRRLVAYTHFLPDNWRKQTHTYDVRDEFSDYFQYKIVLLARELMCIITTPFVLCFVLPKQAPIIVDFIQSRTSSVDGLGDVCVYSLLDLRTNGDPMYHDTESVGRFLTVQKSSVRGGKLEKSWLNFKLNYPGWGQEEDGEDGLAIDHSLSEFQKRTVTESIASSTGSNMASSFTAAADLEKKQRQRNLNDASSHTSSQADHDFFGVSDAAVLPLDSFKYPNSENYFYWLE